MDRLGVYMQENKRTGSVIAPIHWVVMQTSFGCHINVDFIAIHAFFLKCLYWFNSSRIQSVKDQCYAMLPLNQHMLMTI